MNAGHRHSGFEHSGAIDTSEVAALQAAALQRIEELMEILKTDEGSAMAGAILDRITSAYLERFPDEILK